MSENEQFDVDFDRETYDKYRRYDEMDEYEQLDVKDVGVETKNVLIMMRIISYLGLMMKR